MNKISEVKDFLQNLNKILPMFSAKDPHAVDI